MLFSGSRSSPIVASGLLSRPLGRALLRGVSILLLLGAMGCFPEGPQAEERFAGGEDGAEDLFGAGLASEEEVAEVKSVTANLQTARTSGQTMGLVSDIRDVTYRLVGCKSGYGTTLNTFSAQSLSLYRFDRSCEIHVDSVNVQGSVYRLSGVATFNGQPAAVNTFASPSGSKIYLKVLSQLPPLLETSSYAVSFILSESLEGAAVSHTIYEVGISSDVTQINEAGGGVATITVRRALPASGMIEVKLAYEGDATPGIDTNALPSSITMAAGQSSKSFTVSAVNDTVFEGLEFLRIRVAPGLNYLPKNQVADVNINDDDVAVLVADATTYNFGARALNLPHSLKIKLTNIGGAPATQLRSSQNLSAPFNFSGGFPGDEGSCGTTLPAGQSCTLAVGFSPSSTAITTSALNLAYFNGAIDSALELTVRGNGASAAHLVLSESASYEFPPARPNQAQRKHFTLRNLGNATASSLSGSFSSSLFSWAGGAFPGTGGSCTSSLAAGSQCTVVVNFMASTEGFFEGLWQLTYNNNSQVLAQSLTLKASVNKLLANPNTLVTGINRALALQLTASGGSGSVSYEVLSQPRFGTLSGTAPNLVYTPGLNFTQMDTFTFRAIDSSGPSEAAVVRIWVQPRALLVAGRSTLEVLEQSLMSRLEAMGFTVTPIDDNGSSLSDASGKELLLFSRTARRNRYQNKFFDATAPAMVWDQTDMTEMRMLSSNGGATTTRQVRVNNTAHPIAKGVAAGLQTLFTQNESLAYGISTSPNVQAIASTSSSTSQHVIFGYEEGVYLPGNLIAPARRLAAALPEAEDNLTAVAWTLFDQSVSWLMQGWSALLYDNFQREPSQSLGGGWQEFENGEAGAFQIAQNQLQVNSSANIASAKLSLPLQTSGILTWSFYLDFKKAAGAPIDYLQEFQLGRCDLMDKAAPNSSGAAVHLIWGGVASGLAGEEYLGARVGSSIVNLGQVNQRKARISVEVDLTNKRYTVRMPQGSLRAAIDFDAQVAINCLRLTSRNINSSGFTYRGIDQLQLVNGR